MTRSLRHNTAWALVGNLGYAACQWGILVAIAKLTTAADVGRFALALAIAGPVLIASSLHLRTVQATDARAEYPFGIYLGLRLVSTALALVVIAGVALALGYRGATLALILAVALAKACEAVSDVIFGLLQQAENLRRVALSLLAKGILSVVAVGAVLASGGTIVAATLAMTACWAGLLVAYDVPAAARLAAFRPQLHPRTLAALAGLALPLGCVMGLGSLTTNVPRYAIEAQLGTVALGHFAAVAYLVVAASQPVMAMGMAASPRLAKLFVTDHAAYGRLSHRTMLLAGAVGVAAVLAAAVAGRPVLRLAYAPEYAADLELLVWMALAAGAGFVASALGFAVTAARRFPEQLAIAVLALAVCAGASSWLIPHHGLVGAAWAVLAAQVARLLCLAAVYAARCARIPGSRIARAPVRRVLHVFGSMNRGGAETRTLEMMRRLPDARYRFDYCVLSAEPGTYAPEIARLGGRVIPCGLRAGRATFPLRFLVLLRRGRHDVVHSHVHHFSGAILLAARLAGVPTRIAHLRSCTDGHPATRRRRLYRRVMRALITCHATAVIAVSESAMEACFGPTWHADPRRLVIYDGIDASRFQPPPCARSVAAHPVGTDAEGARADGTARVDAAAVRAEFAIPSAARVVIHVGNFGPAKNHRALVEIAARLRADRQAPVFLLVGDGPLRAAIAAEVAARGLAPMFRFAGARDDVPRLLRAADLLVFPSRWEGLPGAVLEALATGLPIVASAIPPIAEIVRHAPGIRTLDPADPDAFAQAITTALGGDAPGREQVLPPIFEIAHAMQRVLACYG